MRNDNSSDGLVMAAKTSVFWRDIIQGAVRPYMTNIDFDENLDYRDSISKAPSCSGGQVKCFELCQSMRVGYL